MLYLCPLQYSRTAVAGIQTGIGMDWNTVRGPQGHQCYHYHFLPLLLYCTALHCIKLHRVVLCCAVLYFTVLHWKGTDYKRLLLLQISDFCDRSLMGCLKCVQYREVWRHVTMVAKFLDRELKQRRQRRQRELEKSHRFISAKQQLCTCVTLFCTFLGRRCTTATWNFPISRTRFTK